TGSRPPRRAATRTQARDPGSHVARRGTIAFRRDRRSRRRPRRRIPAGPGRRRLRRPTARVAAPGRARPVSRRPAGWTDRDRGDDAFKEVRLLSGGERSRLELALLGIQASNVLLLDEPTNHLDIPAREAIEAFMASSPATILVVSHDRRLLETVCESLWIVDGG